MGHQTISLTQLISGSILIMIVILGIVFLVLRMVNKKHLQRIWNYQVIKSNFETLKHNIQFASTPTELQILEDQIEDFYYELDTVRAHDIVVRFYNALRDQARYKKQDFNDSKRISASLAVVIFIVVMSMLNSCATTQSSCDYERTHMTGFGGQHK